MGGYIIRGLIRAVLVVLVVTILLFLTMRLLPGDPLAIMVSSSEIAQISPEQLTALRHEFGLDKPLLTQYYNWISKVIRGDMGKSIYFRTTVTSELGKRVPVTLHLGLLAFIIGFFLGLGAGIICAVRRGTLIDNLESVLG